MTHPTDTRNTNPSIDNDLDRHLTRKGISPPYIQCRTCKAEFEDGMESAVEQEYWHDEVEAAHEEGRIPPLTNVVKSDRDCPICAPDDYYDDTDARIDMEIERRHGL